ncbi:BPSL0761 family protein [Polaromonas naphthalenivorans]|uniref:Uncharacterized protein n=1 Tax=Polaromonas naphthalenivorans (strain CJ2) TaxID=365044 RepID=A1VW78_POLNA|nr:BPSL0761 family protein [Polaromonas naphthalenivorans]ABM39906.1 hypothetical protein Pnap_4841 [Polaromonas naphthalenivorans CJ2]
MTLPFERTRAMLDVRLFLRELTDPRLTPRIPRALRGKAASLLKHFPTNADMDRAHQALPDCFGPVPPFRIRAELAAEAAPKNKLLAGIRDTAQAGKGGRLPGEQTDGAPARTGSKNGD